MIVVVFGPKVVPQFVRGDQISLGGQYLLTPVDRRSEAGVEVQGPWRTAIEK